MGLVRLSASSTTLASFKGLLSNSHLSMHRPDSVLSEQAGRKRNELLLHNAQPAHPAILVRSLHIYCTYSLHSRPWNSCRIRHDLYLEFSTTKLPCYAVDHAGPWVPPPPWLTAPTFSGAANGPPHTSLCRMSSTAVALAAAREVGHSSSIDTSGCRPACFAVTFFG